MCRAAADEHWSKEAQRRAEPESSAQKQHETSPGTDAAGVSAPSRCRCGRGGRSPGAGVARGGPRLSAQKQCETIARGWKTRSRPRFPVGAYCEPASTSGDAAASAGTAASADRCTAKSDVAARICASRRTALGGASAHCGDAPPSAVVVMRWTKRENRHPPTPTDADRSTKRGEAHAGGASEVPSRPSQRTR
jgi:hypothetical protein